VAEVPKSRGTNRKGNLVDIPGERKSSGLELVVLYCLPPTRQVFALPPQNVEKWVESKSKNVRFL
jgi:hypothetical protein